MNYAEDYSTLVLKEMFDYYANLGHARKRTSMLDRKGFQKLLYDAPNVFNGQFNIGDANLAFVQACEDGNDALDLEGLFEALMFIAWKKYPQEDDLAALSRFLAECIYLAHGAPDHAKHRAYQFAHHRLSKSNIERHSVGLHSNMYLEHSKLFQENNTLQNCIIDDDEYTTTVECSSTEDTTILDSIKSTTELIDANIDTYIASNKRPQRPHNEMRQLKVIKFVLRMDFVLRSKPQMNVRKLFWRWKFTILKIAHYMTTLSHVLRIVYLQQVKRSFQRMHNLAVSFRSSTSKMLAMVVRRRIILTLRYLNKWRIAHTEQTHIKRMLRSLVQRSVLRGVKYSFYMWCRNVEKIGEEGRLIKIKTKVHLNNKMIYRLNDALTNKHLRNLRRAITSWKLCIQLQIRKEQAIAQIISLIKKNHLKIGWAAFQLLVLRFKSYRNGLRILSQVVKRSIQRTLADSFRTISLQACPTFNRKHSLLHNASIIHRNKLFERIASYLSKGYFRKLYSSWSKWQRYAYQNSNQQLRIQRVKYIVINAINGSTKRHLKGAFARWRFNMVEDLNKASRILQQMCTITKSNILKLCGKHFFQWRHALIVNNATDAIASMDILHAEETNKANHKLQEYNTMMQSNSKKQALEKLIGFWRIRNLKLLGIGWHTFKTSFTREQMSENFAKNARIEKHGLILRRSSWMGSIGKPSDAAIKKTSWYRWRQYVNDALRFRGAISSGLRLVSHMIKVRQKQQQSSSFARWKYMVEHFNTRVASRKSSNSIILSNFAKYSNRSSRKYWYNRWKNRVQMVKGIREGVSIMDGILQKFWQDRKHSLFRMWLLSCRKANNSEKKHSVVAHVVSRFIRMNEIHSVKKAFLNWRICSRAHSKLLKLLRHSQCKRTMLFFSKWKLNTLQFESYKLGNYLGQLMKAVSLKRKYALRHYWCHWHHTMYLVDHDFRVIQAYNKSSVSKRKRGSFLAWRIHAILQSRRRAISQESGGVHIRVFYTWKNFAEYKKLNCMVSHRIAIALKLGFQKYRKSKQRILFDHWVFQHKHCQHIAKSGNLLAHSHVRLRIACCIRNQGLYLNALHASKPLITMYFFAWKSEFTVLKQAKRRFAAIRRAIHSRTARQAFVTWSANTKISKAMRQQYHVGTFRILKMDREIIALHKRMVLNKWRAFAHIQAESRNTRKTVRRMGARIASRYLTIQLNNIFNTFKQNLNATHDVTIQRTTKIKTLLRKQESTNKAIALSQWKMQIHRLALRKATLRTIICMLRVSKNQILSIKFSKWYTLSKQQSSNEKVLECLRQSQSLRMQTFCITRKKRMTQRTWFAWKMFLVFSEARKRNMKLQMTKMSNNKQLISFFAFYQWSINSWLRRAMKSQAARCLKNVMFHIYARRMLNAWNRIKVAGLVHCISSLNSMRMADMVTSSRRQRQIVFRIALTKIVRSFDRYATKRSFRDAIGTWKVKSNAAKTLYKILHALMHTKKRRMLSIACHLWQRSAIRKSKIQSILRSFNCRKLKNDLTFVLWKWLLAAKRKKIKNLEHILGLNRLECVFNKRMVRKVSSSFWRWLQCVYKSYVNDLNDQFCKHTAAIEVDCYLARESFSKLRSFSSQGYAQFRSVYLFKVLSMIAHRQSITAVAMAFCKLRDFSRFRFVKSLHRDVMNFSNEKLEQQRNKLLKLIGNSYVCRTNENITWKHWSMWKSNIIAQKRTLYDSQLELSNQSLDQVQSLIYMIKREKLTSSYFGQWRRKALKFIPVSLTRNLPLSRLHIWWRRWKIWHMLNSHRSQLIKGLLSLHNFRCNARKNSAIKQSFYTWRHVTRLPTQSKNKQAIALSSVQERVIVVRIRREERLLLSIHLHHWICYMNNMKKSRSRRDLLLCKIIFIGERLTRIIVAQRFQQWRILTRRDIQTTRNAHVALQMMSHFIMRRKVIYLVRLYSRWKYAQLLSNNTQNISTEFKFNCLYHSMLRPFHRVLRQSLFAWKYTSTVCKLENESKIVLKSVLRMEQRMKNHNMDIGIALLRSILRNREKQKILKSFYKQKWLLIDYHIEPSQHDLEEYATCFRLWLIYTIKSKMLRKLHDTAYQSGWITRPKLVHQI